MGLKWIVNSAQRITHCTEYINALWKRRLLLSPIPLNYSTIYLLSNYYVQALFEVLDTQQWLEQNDLSAPTSQWIHPSPLRTCLVEGLSLLCFQSEIVCGCMDVFSCTLPILPILGQNRARKPGLSGGRFCRDFQVEEWREQKCGSGLSVD